MGHCVGMPGSRLRAGLSAIAAVGKALLYTGNGSSLGVTGASFSPDLGIIRRRSSRHTTLTGSQWVWIDNVRGITKVINSSTSSAETTDANAVTSFDSDGVTVGSSNGTNLNDEDYLLLVLQEIAGALDIVAFTGTGSAHAENHSLGVAPELMLVKNRSNNSRNWAIYAASQGNTKGANFSSAAFATQTGYWNSTSPNSTQFTIGTSTLTNESGANLVAYLFAPLNPGVAIGTYTGNGGANGPLVTIGFQGRFGIFKRTDSTGDWILFDNQRDPTTPHNTYNRVDVGSADTDFTCTNAAGGIDFQATTFQAVDADGTNCALNVNGATYLYLVIA